MKEAQIVDLLSMSLFQLDPRASSSKEALWRSLVETALYYAEKPLSQEEIATAIAYLLEQPEMNISSEVQRAIEGCIERGSLTGQDDLLILTETGFTHVKEMVKCTNLDEEAFDAGLTRSVETELGFAVSDNVVLCSTVKHVLQEMFRNKGVKIQRLLKRSSFTLEDVLRAGAQYDAIKAIREKLKPTSMLLGGGAEKGIIAGIRNHFENLSEGSKRYVARLYNKVFYHQILNLDPNLHTYQRAYFKITRLYLDTNTLVAYLFDSHPRYSVTGEIIDASKRLDFQIVISPATLKEMNKLIENTRRLHSSLGDDTRVARLLTETRQGRQSNPILVTFLMKKRGNPSLLWDNFIAPYHKLEDLLLQKEILVEDEEYDGVRTDENYPKVWSTIREVRHEWYPDRIVDHDADNFVLIHRLRQEHKPHPMGQTVWLLSWDSSLRTTEYRLRKTYSVPHCYILDKWGGVILPYQNINNFAFDDYILYLVRSSLGITIDMDGLDLDFLEPLHRPEFDIDSLLELDDPDYVARTLATLQQNREMRKLAERARTAKAPEEIVEIGRQLSSHLLETIVNDKKSSEEKAEQLARRVQELESKLHELEARTIWQKLKALFGLK